MGYVRLGDDDLRHWAAEIEAAILAAVTGGAPNVIPIKRSDPLMAGDARMADLLPRRRG